MNRTHKLGTKVAAKQAAFVGLDIGNTRLTAGAALRDGSLIHSEERPAPSDLGAEATVPRLLDMADRACQAARDHGCTPAAIGLGFGGPVDYRRQTTRRSFHSPGWGDRRLGEVFEDLFDIPSLLDNDANAAGLAEALFGVSRGTAVSLYVNVGTGLGGAIIIDGEIHHGATGSAGEIGHTVVDPAGPVCNCGKRGCAEALASGTALARAAKAAGVGGASETQEPTGSAVIAAARSGDEVCVAIVEKAAAALGIAIANAVNLLDPDIVVLGGGVAEAGDVWLAPLRDSFARHAVSPPARVTGLAVAQLGYRAGVLGAAALGMRAFGASERRSAR